MRRVRNGFAVLALLLGVLSLVASPAQGAERRVILVLLDRLETADLLDAGLPHLAGLAGQGAAGLASNKTAGALIPENTHATVGAGSVAAPGKAGAVAMEEADPYGAEKAGQVFRRRTGRAVEQGAVVLPEWPAAQAANARAGGGEMGLLGETLRQAGVRVAVLGNSDGAEPRRYGALLAADSGGLVPAGKVGPSTLRAMPDGPLPLATDYRALWRELERWRPVSGLLVVELGDLNRLDEVSDRVEAPVWERARRDALRRADDFLGRLARRLSPGERLYLFSPTPAGRAQAEKRLLTPLLVYEQGGRAGLLVSGSTRRPGLVASTDLAPAVLEYLGIPQPAGMIGRPLEVLPAPAATAALERLERQAAATHRARPQLVRGYILAQIGLVAASVAAYSWRPGWRRWLRKAVLYLATVPLAFLFLGAFPAMGVAEAAALSAVLGLGLSWAAQAAAGRRDLPALLLVAGATVLALAADVLAGAQLIRRSVLGYDPMGGARYYGLGNEYMGVLLGAAAVTGAAVREQWRERRWVLPVLAGWYALLTAVIGSSRWGANVGGAVAAVGCFGVTLLLLRGGRLGWRSLAGLGGVVAGVLLLLAWYDLQRAVPAQSHLARALRGAAAAGGLSLWEIAARKLAMNVKLIRYTIWSRVFLTMLAGAAIMAWRPPGLLRELRRRYPALSAGLAGSLAGSLVALAANDSGIVAAATAMIFGVAVFLVIGLEEREGEL